MKKQTGITLIALIITIIVLLILAVVTIGAVQDGGIITQAQNATQKHVIGDEKERIQLAYSDYKISKYEPLERTADQDELETFFLGENKQGVGAMTLINTEKSTQDTFIVDYKGEEIKINLSEATFNNDTNEIYLYFSYNGYKYKLTVEDTNAAMTKELEVIEAIESKLKVEGADVIGEEKTKWTIKFSDTGNIYSLTGDGKITQKTAEMFLLEQYILGTDLAGRPMTDIMDMEKGSFKNEESTMAKAETRLTVINSAVEEDEFLIVYFRDTGNERNKVNYKFRANYYYNEETDEINAKTDAEYGVVKIYEQEEGTRVGKTIKYDDKIWTILYDDSTNGLQMICNQSLLYNDSEFWLGSTDSLITNWDSLITVADLDNNGTLSTLEKSVYSYNNAIDTLNTACENLLKDAEGKYKSENITDVRCVGSNPTNKSAENETLYTSENLSIWPSKSGIHAAGIGNKRCKSTDLNYVSDIDRMKVLGIYDSVSSDLSYWLASRFVEVRYDREIFRLCYVHNSGVDFCSFTLLEVCDLEAYAGSYRYALRPVVTLKSDVELVEDTSGEADYILN